MFLYSSEPSPEPPYKNPGTVIARKFENTGTVNVTKILRGVIITVNFADQGILDKELHQRRPDLYLFNSQLTPVSRYPLTSLGMGQIRRAGRENPNPEILGFVTLGGYDILFPVSCRATFNVNREEMGQSGSLRTKRWFGLCLLAPILASI